MLPQDTKTKTRAAQRSRKIIEITCKNQRKKKPIKTTSQAPQMVLVALNPKTQIDFRHRHPNHCKALSEKGSLGRTKKNSIVVKGQAQ